MPTIDYYGHRLTLDILYSYDRVSSRQQSREKGGEGLDRQGLLHRQFSEHFSIPIDYELVDVASASQGEHLQDGGALCGFMNLATGKIAGRRLRPNAGLAVESFSRLCRLPIDDALHLFLQIIRAGVTLITLVDHRAYTRASLRANRGEIHYVAAHLEAARAEAEAKSYFSRASWAARRDKVIDMHVGWVVPTADRSGYVEVEGSRAIFARMFRECETMGYDKVAGRFNADNIKPFACWNHTPTIWYGNHIRRLVTGQEVLGYREIAHYEGKKRVKTGKFERVYPAMVSEKQHKRTNAARRAATEAAHERGETNGGRKGTGFANLFQQLAKCAHCGAAMKLGSTVKRGKRYQYFRCSNLRRQACNHPHTFDYALVEREFLAVFADIVAVYLARAEPHDDPAAPIHEAIAAKYAELSRLDARTIAMATALRSTQEQTNATDREIAELVETIGINREKHAIRYEIDKLERKRDQVQQFQTPVEDVANMTDLIANLAKQLGWTAGERYELRANINTQLKRIIVRITFDAKGEMRVFLGRDGKPPEHPHPKFRTDYRLWFREDGTVAREHLYFAGLRAHAHKAVEPGTITRTPRERLRANERKSRRSGVS
jgi:hypothetical protein